MEDVLSRVGLHGGAVTLTKDCKALGSTQDNPHKVYMGGERQDTYYQITPNQEAIQSLNCGRKYATLQLTRVTMQI